MPSRSPRREGVLVSLELARRRSGAAVDGRVPGPAAVQGGRLIVPPSWVASAWAVPAQGGFSPVPPGAA
ncbi:MAG: hypothetical protein U0Q15_16140 [Kineosporiaceae bacterium]